MLTNVFVTVNDMAKLVKVIIELPGPLNLGGRISLDMSHGKAPSPKPMAVKKIIMAVNGIHLKLTISD